MEQRRRKREGEGRDNMKEVFILKSKVVEEFNVEYIKFRNILCLYLNKFSKYVQNLKLDVNLESCTWVQELENTARTTKNSIHWATSSSNSLTPSFEADRLLMALFVIRLDSSSFDHGFCNARLIKGLCPLVCLIAKSEHLSRAPPSNVAVHVHASNLHVQIVVVCLINRTGQYRRSVLHRHGQRLRWGVWIMDIWSDAGKRLVGSPWSDSIYGECSSLYAHLSK